MPKLRRVSGADRKKAILLAAGQLFAERGYTATSMRDIGAAVGTTDAALYKHFRAKREILEALYEVCGFVHEIEVFERTPGEGDIQEQFEAAILLSADMWGQNADFLRLVFNQALKRETQALEVHKSLVSRWRRGAERLYLIYADRGEVSAADAHLFSRTLVDLLFGAFMERLVASETADGGAAFADSAFRQRLCDMLAMLIRAVRMDNRAPPNGSRARASGSSPVPPIDPVAVPDGEG